MDAGTLTREIQAKGNEIGFTAIGIASAVSNPKDFDQLTEWLHRGYHASMSWIERDVERRANPDRILPGVRSIISVAMNYYTPHEHIPQKGEGKISRYAWGDDYHRVMAERLGILEAFIHERIPGARTRIYSDTGPVMEKAWAMRAGIGWIGKHSNIISRSHGSWLFLGEILTDLELFYDQPADDMCGTCSACIDACPTVAIVEPYVVDARSCISYWTIEHKGQFDSSIAERLDGWLFGCDVCQDVCPWNSFRQGTAEPAFQPRPGNVTPKLESIVRMTEAEFSDRFLESPIKRTKRDGLVRNAAALLGSQRGSS